MLQNLLPAFLVLATSFFTNNERWMQEDKNEKSLLKKKWNINKYRKTVHIK